MINPQAVKNGQILIEGNASYYYTFQAFSTVTSPWINSNCNEIAFWNTGTSNVIINNVINLLPNDFVSLNGNINELDKTQYIYSFTGTGTNSLIVIKKTYL